MKLFGVVAAAVSVAVVVVGVGTAAAAPQPGAVEHERGPHGLRLHGIAGTVGYQAGLSEDQRSVSTTLRAGSFRLAQDGKVVTINDAAGAVVAALPMAVRLENKRVALEPKIEADGTKLTLAPAGAAKSPLRDIASSQDKFFAEMTRLQEPMIQGAVIGGIIGFLLGFPLGLFVLDFITVPITTVLGAAIGAAIAYSQAGGQPAVDLALAYFNGAP